MDPSKSTYSGRVICLTQDTINALHLILNGTVSLIKLLLLNKAFNNVLPGSFQSDRFEGEFDIYRQSVGGCYYISIKQIMNSLALQILKPFTKLDIEEVVSHSKQECCTASLTEGETFMLNEAFSLRITLSDIEGSSIFYISGYVAFKEGLALKDDSNIFKISEFLFLLSRAKLAATSPVI